MRMVELDRPGPFRPVLDPVFTVINAEDATSSLPSGTKNRKKLESTFEFSRLMSADRKVAGRHYYFQLQKNTGNFDIGITGLHSDPA